MNVPAIVTKLATKSTRPVESNPNVWFRRIPKLLKCREGWYSRRSALFLLLVLVGCTYLLTATRLAITDDGDALYAGVAKEMLRRGDWVTPYADGVRFLDKPPLMYWLMAASYAAFGVSEFSARLPSVLAVVGTTLLLFFTGRKAGGEPAGLISGLAFAFSVGTFLLTRMVFPDILFVFLLTLSIHGFLDWYMDDRRPLLPAMLFYGGLAGAVLTKGLIGIVFPAAVVLIFVAWHREWAVLREFHVLSGSLLFLAVALPWHIIAAQRNSGFLWHYFVNEHLLRFLGRRQPFDYESIPLLVFWALILLFLFPWSAFLPAVFRLLRRSSMNDSRTHTAVCIHLIWAVVVLVFFSLSSRIEHYALPVFPPTALLVGLALTQGIPAGSSRDLLLERAVKRGFGILAIIGGFFLLLLAGAAAIRIFGLWPVHEMRETVGRNSHAYQNYFGPMFDLPGEVWAGFQLLAAGVVLSWFAGTLSAWRLNLAGRRVSAAFALGTMMAVFSFFVFRAQGICEPALSSREFGMLLAPIYRAGDSLVVVGDYETANSISFSSPIPIAVYAGRAAVLEAGFSYRDAPRVVLSRAELESRWYGPTRTFLLARDEDVGSLRLSPFYLVHRSAGRTLVSNRRGLGTPGPVGASGGDATSH